MHRTGAATPRIALAGSPNTGKTTLFNRLTGSDQRVGNYAGVTVERVEGRLELPGGTHAAIADVPGCYSLSARSEEERLALIAIAGLPPEEPPDLVVLVVDATQLSRNLYLVLQTIEVGVPLVVALNMVDRLEQSGLVVDAGRLAEELGVPVVPVSASRGTGLGELGQAIEATLANPALGRSPWHWRPAAGALEEDIEAVAAAIPAAWVPANGSPLSSPGRREALALWALLSVDAQDELSGVPDDLRRISSERQSAAEAAGRELDAEVIRGRYAWIDERLPRFLEEKGVGKTWSERVDAVLLHPALGFALFLLAMGVVFQSLFTWADPAIGAIEGLVDVTAQAVASALPEGVFRDFVIDGLFAGVGSVIVFLPQILLLFLFLGLMEDTGYMARVAFLMDRLMKALGLHGRAFVPMLSGFACAIPAVMATRTMERRRDRMLTMMVVPLMTCSARLPVYTLVIAALFPPREGDLPVQGLLMVGMYVFSTVVALVCAAVLGRTLFKGPKVPLILELPPYRMPHLPSVLRSMWVKARLFLTEAGGVIFVCTIVLWGLLAFPREPELSKDYDALRAAAVAEADTESVAALDTEEAGERLRKSYGGRLGRVLEPTIAPLGFDWKIGVGLIGAFAAREVFVSTMGIVYGVGDEVDEESTSLRQRIQDERHADGRPVYSPLVGLSLMVFFALACQCMSTLAVVKRETGGWRWPLFLFAYMTALAWGASFAVFQGGRLLGYG